MFNNYIKRAGIAFALIFSSLGYLKAQVLLDAHSSSNGATTWNITTTYPNELILVSAGGCCGVLSTSPGTVTVDGNNATYENGIVSNGEFPAYIWAYVAPTTGTHAIACTESGESGPWYFNFAVSVYQPSAALSLSNIIIGGDSANEGPLSVQTSITTTKASSFIYGFVVYNDNAGSGTVNWQKGLTELDHYFITNGVDGAHADSTMAIPGKYVITVTDTGATNPWASLTLVAVQPGCTISVGDSVVTNATACASNGSAKAFALTGTKPYTYSWNTIPVQTSAMATGLSGGTYIVTITDSNGCTGMDSVKISQPKALMLADSTVNSTVCAGSCTTINSFVSGGTPAYTYMWSNGATTSSITVCPTLTTTYKNTIIDANGCKDSTSITITAVPLPVITASAAKDTICSTMTKDSLTGSPAGGTFSGTGVSGSNFNPSVAGAGNQMVIYTYTDTVTGCTNRDTIKIKVEVCTGINEINALDAQVELYPNPFNQSIEVNISMDGPVVVNMFNMLGENVGTWTVDKGRTILNTQQYPAGVYSLQFKTQNGVLNKKLIKVTE